MSSLHISSPDQLFSQAQALYRSGDYEQAEALFFSLVEKGLLRKEQMDEALEQSKSQDKEADQYIDAETIGGKTG